MWIILILSRFKSQDKKGLNDTLGAISPQELLKLLNSKDHADVFDKGKEDVFNSEDLEKLLDRSDLKRDSSDKENQNGKDNKSKIFKVVDTDVSGGMGSFMWMIQNYYRGSYLVDSGNDYDWKANEENKPFYGMSYCFSSTMIGVKVYRIFARKIPTRWKSGIIIKQSVKIYYIWLMCVLKCIRWICEVKLIKRKIEKMKNW